MLAYSNSATCCQIIMLTCWIVMLISYLHVCLSTFHLFSHLKTFENFAAPRQWWRAYMSEIFVNGAFNKIINKSSPVYVIQFDKIFSWKVGVTFDIRHNYLTSQHDTKFTSFSDKLTRKKIMSTKNLTSRSKYRTRQQKDLIRPQNYLTSTSSGRTMSPYGRSQVKF